MVLPRKVVKAGSQNPRKLLIFSKPKTGKTQLLAGLENCLILDLETGSDYIDALKIQANSLEELIEVGKSIKAENEKENKKIYKYIAIDTITRMEQYAWELGLQNYKKSLIGKNFSGDVHAFKQLPKGAAYVYLWESFEKLYRFFEGLTEHLILVGHLKRTAINKELTGEEIEATDLDLVGKLKTIVAADCDAIGMLVRKGNESILSFKTSPTDLICGARSEHLTGQEIVVAEKIEGEFTYYWNKIFLPN